MQSRFVQKGAGCLIVDQQLFDLLPQVHLMTVRRKKRRPLRRLQLLSWEEAESGSWEDPEFLKPFEEKGERVSLLDGDRKALNLTAIPTKTPESART